jgi:hypothetical protein
MPSYETDIKPLFTAADRACMLGAPIPADKGGPFDLHSHAAVAARADRILLEVAAGMMPMGGPAWGIDKVRLFALWIDGGKQA